MSETRRNAPEPIGFIGLGIMGSAVAANLQTKASLLVWNRTRSACDPLRAAGAEVALSAAEVFERARIVFIMLSDEAAIDAVLKHDDGIAFPGRIVVLMSTVSPVYSERLARRIERDGGAYVEAPVSGSRQPALDGKLVAMIAGDPGALDEVEPLMLATSSQVFRCGPVPSALTMKLAVNTFLITLVTGLAESFHFAESNGVDREALQAVLDAGPLASAVSRAKGAKLAAEDWEPHATIPDVRKNSRLVRDHARRTGTACPLMDTCDELYAETEALGHSADDMVAVVSALRQRTRSSHIPLTIDSSR